MPGHAVRFPFCTGSNGGRCLHLLLDSGRRNPNRLRGDFVSRRRGRTVQINPRSGYNQTSGGRCTEDWYWREPTSADWNRLWRRQRLLREKDNFAAAVTLGQMRQALEPFMLRQHTFYEGVERIRIGM